VIAEYDGNNNLLRKYIYGPGIDQPVCMIEVADANAVYYYHFDAPFDCAQGRLGQRRGAERCGGRYRPDLRILGSDCTSVTGWRLYGYSRISSRSSVPVAPSPSIPMARLVTF